MSDLSQCWVSELKVSRAKHGIVRVVGYVQHEP